LTWLLLDQSSETSLKRSFGAGPQRQHFTVVGKIVMNIKSTHELKRLEDLEAALAFIAKIARAAYEQDDKLRADSARTMKRIAEKAERLLK
jgi:hypothetical protein